MTTYKAKSNYYYYLKILIIKVWRLLHRDICEAGPAPSVTALNKRQHQAKQAANKILALSSHNGP